MFDESIQDAFKTTAMQQFLNHPELRSICVVLDFRGQLNTTRGIKYALWVEPSGLVSSPAAIIGSAMQCLRTMEVMLERAGALATSLHEAVMEKLDKLKTTQEQSRELETERKEQ